jgi:nucleotide-binding universal stress UspA family protein
MRGQPTDAAAGTAILSCVACGVDGSEAGEEAVRQGARLCAPDGRLLLVSVARPSAASHPQAAVAIDRQTEDALRRAEATAGARGEPLLLVGDPEGGLLRAAFDHHATLLVVGSHGTGRVRGILTGSVATAMLHRAPCSVLVARPPRAPGEFPARVAVGFDGSASSRSALGLATGLVARFGAELVVVTAGDPVEDVEDLPSGSARHVVGGDVVAALLDASAECDLLVLGARGLRGPRALGSVSERVAHRASSSVLVVRPAVAEPPEA